MHWILQQTFLAEAPWQQLIATLERFEISYSIHDVVPKTGELTPEPSLAHNNVICVGSYAMRHVAARNGWKPGVFDLFECEFERQRLRWGSHLLNFHATVSSIADIKSIDSTAFVRPIHDSKSFTGRTFTPGEFNAWQKTVCDIASDRQNGPSPDTQIQLSKPVRIYAEYRFWIVKGQIITMSLYKRGSDVVYSPEVDERIRTFVEDRIAEWTPHDAFVIDVCDAETGIKIVEINTINCSGFYAADVQRLVMAMEDAFTGPDNPGA